MVDHAVLLLEGGLVLLIDHDQAEIGEGQEQRAAGADLALVFFAGHGMAADEGNILTPVDAKVDCATGAVSQGVVVERIMAATAPARARGG